MSDTSGSVTVTLLNADGAPTAYASQQNTMTLSLVNQTGALISVQPGTPANPPSGAFGFVLYFDAFYADASDAAQLSITADGWEAQYFSGDWAGWVVVATEEQDWDYGAALDFTVSGFDPTVQVGTYYLSLGLYNLPGADAVPCSVVVGVANAPVTQNKELYTTVAITLTNTGNVTDTDVLITKNPDEPVKNSYRLTIANTNLNAALVPSTTPWTDVKFTLAFPYADSPGYYALTTVDAADAIQVGIQQDPASGWNAPVKKDGPVWEITPKASNKYVLGTGSAAAVTFSIDEVITQLIPGTTELYLQYNNIPGYNDGFLSLLLNKSYPAMKIQSFTAGQTSFSATYPGSNTAYLNWEVDNSLLVQLDGVGQVPSSQSNQPVTIDASQTVLLTAYDTVEGVVDAWALSFTVSPSLGKRWLPCGAIMAWEGPVSSIPVNWHLCDGTNGTPDLRDRFVLGAGKSESPGQYDDHPTHTHTLTGFSVTALAQPVPDHTHAFPTSWYARNLSSGSKTSIDTDGTFKTSTQFPPRGGHSHNVPVNFPSIATTAVNGKTRPKWYALCYIMLLTPTS